MQTVTLVSAFVLAAVALLTAPQTADAECCHAHLIPTPTTPLGEVLCGDCTDPTPYCGYGPCNVFGCNCDGGCRKGSCYQKKRSTESEIDSAESIVTAGDVNDDGVLSIKEAVKLLQKQQGHSAAHLSTVRSLDKNKDGQLSADEIDS